MSTPANTSQGKPSFDPTALLHVPFLAHLGVEVESMEPGLAVLTLEPRPEHYNSWGGVHGGVIMTLLDVCMAVAGRAYDPANLSGVTVDMASSFISPGKGKQIATGRVIAQSRTLWRCEGEIRNALDNSLVARAIGTFKFKNLLHKGKSPVGDA